MYNQHKYQLVSPIVGSKIYQAADYKKGAKRCYNELMGMGSMNSNEFIMMDIDTYETYTYKIHRKNRPKQRGGNAENISIESVNKLIDSKIAPIENQLRKIVEKIKEPEIKKEDKEEIIEVTKDVPISVDVDKLPTNKPKVIKEDEIQFPKSYGAENVIDELNDMDKVDYPVDSRDVYRLNMSRLRNLKNIDKNAIDDDNNDGCSIQ
jgi:hypothetical protein